jgi:RecG-like helicase
MNVVTNSQTLAGARIAALQGRMPSDEEEAVMRAFADGLLDIIVGTTVIEVGVDVPNASIMVVMDAERFGVSQLHQLRGLTTDGDLILEARMTASHHRRRPRLRAAPGNQRSARSSTA